MRARNKITLCPSFHHQSEIFIDTHKVSITGGGEKELKNMIMKLTEVETALKNIKLNLPEIEIHRDSILDLLESISDLALRLHKTVLDTVIEPKEDNE